MRQLRVEVMRLQAKHMAKHEAEAKLEQLAQAALQADEITRKHLTKMSDKMATVTVRQRRRSRSAGDPRNQTYVEEEDTCGSSFHSTRYEIMGNLALRLMQTKFLLKKERRLNQELKKERRPPRNDGGGGGEGRGRVEEEEAKEKGGATWGGVSTGLVAHLEEASGVDRATGHADTDAADPFFHPFPSNAAPPETAYSTHLELGEHENAMAAHLTSLEMLNESLNESLNGQGTQERKANQERFKAPPGLGSGLTDPVASSNAKMHAKLTVGGKAAAAPAVAEEDGEGTSRPPTEEWGCDFCDDTYITEREAEVHESVCSANPAVNISPIKIADSSVCPGIGASPSASSHDTIIPDLVEDTGPIGTDEMKSDVPLGVGLGISLAERIQVALGGGGQRGGINEEETVQASSTPGAAKAAQASQSTKKCESRRLKTSAGQEQDEVKKGDADGIEEGRPGRPGSGRGRGSGGSGSAPPSIPSSPPPPPSLQQPTAKRQHPARQQQDEATGGVADAAIGGSFPAETPVVIKGLQSASGSRLNGKAATVHPDQSGQKPGRVAVVLVGEGGGVGGVEGEGVPREQISIKRSNLFLQGS